MPTLTLNVSSSTDDARCTSTGASFNTTVTTQYLGDFSGTDYWNGLRWTNVAIPQGATINSALLSLYSAGTATGTTTRIIWYGEAADNPGTFTSTTKPTQRTLTAASTTKEYDSANWGSVGFGINPSDVTTIVQEVVNRSGWMSGNALVLIGHNNASDSNSHVGFSTYDRAVDRGSQLVIDYSTDSTPPVATGQIKVWDNTAFVAKPVKVWGGSAWVTKPVKYWDGSTWTETGY